MRLRAVGARPAGERGLSPLTTLCLILGGLAMGLAAGLVFMMVVRSGLMDDFEDVKFQMIREDHES